MREGGGSRVESRLFFASVTAKTPQTVEASFVARKGKKGA